MLAIARSVPQPGTHRAAGGTRRGGLIRLGGAIAAVGVVAILASLDGVTLRKFQNVSAGGQMAGGIGPIVLGGGLAGLGHLPAMSRRTKGIAWIGAAAAAGSSLLMIVLLLVFASRPARPTVAGPTAAAVSPRVAAVAAKPTPQVAPMMSRPPAVSASPATRNTTPPAVTTVSAAPAWASEAQVTRIDLRNAKPANAPAIRSAVAIWNGAAMLGPTPDGTCTIWVRAHWTAVLHTQRLGRIAKGEDQTFEIDWGKPAVRAAPVLQRVSSGPGGPPPAWANAPGAATIILHGVTADERDAIEAALRMTGYPGWQPQNADRNNDCWLWVRVSPDAVATGQTLGQIVAQRRNVLEIIWGEPPTQWTSPPPPTGPPPP